MMSSVTTTPNPKEGMNKVPPNLGMLYLCTFLELGRSKIPYVLQSFTTSGVPMSENTRLMAKAMRMYVELMTMRVCFLTSSCYYNVKKCYILWRMTINLSIFFNIDGSAAGSADF